MFIGREAKDATFPSFFHELLDLFKLILFITFKIFHIIYLFIIYPLGHYLYVYFI